MNSSREAVVKQTLLLVLILLARVALAQDPSLDAPVEAVIGSQIEISWTGPGNNYDTIYVVSADAEEGAAGSNAVAILNKRNPLLLTMPEIPGQYQLRYSDNQSKQVLARSAITVVDVPTAINAPATTTIGVMLEVSWEGPGNNYDGIGIFDSAAPAEARALEFGGILNGRAVQLRMPDQPGVYELRYITTRIKRVLSTRQITVEDVATSLSAPEFADIGQNIDVNWNGPGNDYDRIEIHAVGAADDARAESVTAILNEKNPISMRVPEAEGDYELRYLTYSSGRIMSRLPLRVGAVETNLAAPASVNIGAELAVDWTGPGNDYDIINLYPAGAADDAQPLAGGAILNGVNPISFRVPETEGEYEIRYITANSDRILARAPIQITAVSAALQAQARGTAMMPFEISWEGPGNEYDLIALYEAGAADNAEAVRQVAILNQLNPVTMQLPEAEGNFELRYITTQDRTVLARRQLLIEPAGMLAVVFEREGEYITNTGVGAVELILDASGSMLQREDGVRRIEIARTVLDELVREHLSEENDFALRVFGHKEVDKCRTDLEIAVAPLNRQQAADRISSINAMNLARTPIADSLALVPSDLAGVEGPKTIILITDGEETCDGDPAAVIESLRASGLDVQISVVGFAIDDAQLRSDFESWAELGGGSYFDARSAEELIQSLRTVISGPFRVFDAQDNVVGQGVIGGAPIVLPAGTYRVETTGSPAQLINGVEIKPRETTEAFF